MKEKRPENPLLPEDELDLFINALNQECRPEESESPETAELQAIVRKVRSLRPLEEAREDFPVELRQKLIAELHQKPIAKSPQNLNQRAKTKKKFLPWTALVASFLVFVFLVSSWSGSNQDIVMAMEKSVKQLENYHGILEKVSTNAAGERQLLQRTEIWSEGDQYATQSEEGIIAVNNGERRWVTNPQNKEVRLLPLYLDPHDFDLRKEATKAQQYPHKIVGEDTIAGRATTQLEITPSGGLPYHLWIDTETHLPIQLQTAMQKSLQTTYTFVTIEPNIAIPEATFNYNPPQGYQVVDQNPDKLMNNVDEAISESGLTPLLLSENPQRIFASSNRIVFDLDDTVVIESKATAPVVLDPLASLGQAGEGPLEILSNSLRWLQNGLEIKVQGQRAEDVAKQITANLVIPEKGQALPNQPQVKVEVDMEVVKNNQQQVDAGSSPWQLDPVQVAFTFAALQISPEGINGEPPLDYEALKVSENNGELAVIQISEGPIETVYVKRLIRQDQSGIWTVIGYNLR